MSGNAGRTIGMIGLSLVGGFAGMALAGSLMLSGAAYSLVVGMGYMAGSFIGQMVFPAPSVKNVPFEGYPLQSSGKGQAIPVEYGTTRMAGNVIYMSDKTHYHFEEAGEKGGGGGAEQTGYRRSFCIAICEGERTVIRIWEGKHEVPTGRIYSSGGVAIEDPHDFGLGIRPVGGKGEAQWSQYEQDVTVFDGDGANDGLADLIGEDYARYKNLCCVFFDSYDLGTVDMLPNFTFEVTDPGLSEPLGLLVGAYVNGAYRVDTKYEITAHMETGDGSSVDHNQATGRYAMSAFPATGHDEIPARVWEADGTELDITFEAPGGGWGATRLTRGVRFSADGQYLFITTIDPERAYKYDLSDGSIVWESDDTDMGGTAYNHYGIDVDANDKLYIPAVLTTPPYESRTLVRLDPATGLFEKEWKFCSGTRDVHIAANGWLFLCGASNSSELTYGDGPCQGWLCDLDGSEVRRLVLTTDTGKTSWASTYVNGYWYVWTDTIDGKNLWKLDNDLNVIASIAGPDAVIVHIWAAPNNMIGINGNADVASGSNVWVRLYDEDLNEFSFADGTSDDFPSAAYASQYGSEAMYMYFPDDPPAGLDANPADIIEDQLTNTRYGARMSADYINAASFATIWQYCQDNDLLISPEFSMSRPVLDNVQHVCSHFGGFVYWIGGILYLGAWRAETPSIHIKQKDLVSEDDGPPVQVHKRKYSESRNSIEVSWRNRADIYGPAITPAKDDVDIRYSGKLRKQQIDLGACKRPELAQKLALRYLIDSMYRFSTYSFTLGYKHSLLKVGTVVLLSDGYKIEDQRIRIVGVAEAKDGRTLEVEAIDDISDHYPDLTWTPQTTARTPDAEITTDDLGDPIIASREDWHIPAVRLSLTPTTAYVDGWHIYISRDGITYSFMETVHISGVTGGAANSSGSLLSAIPAARAVTYRGDESFLVDVGTITDLRTDITDQQFFDGTRLIKVGDEIMAYKTCEEQPTEGQWRVTSLIRGMYQTEPVAHTIGETVSTLDIDYVGAFAASDIGKTLYVKALTAYGNVGRAIADADAHEIVVKGNYQRPYGASAVRLTSDEMDGGTPDYDGATLDAYWNLAGKTAGFNIGGQDGGGVWVYGDDEGDLVPQSGVAFGSYLQDPALQGVDLIFREQDGTYAGTTGLGIVSTATVTKATDLGGNNPARIDVVPRHSLQATRIETVLVDDGS